MLGQRARYPMVPCPTLQKRPLFIAQNHRRYRPTRTAGHRHTLQHPMPEDIYDELYFRSK